MTSDKPSLRREIRFMDTTLRDGHQCLWATRMTTAMMLPIAEKLDQAGFEIIDLMSGVQFDVAIRHLKENPWERIRLMRERVTRTPLQANLRSKSVLSFDMLPDDINALWIERLIANGIRSVRAFDALNDMDNIVDSLRLVKKLGARGVGAVVFSESPVHTDALYVAKTRELIERAGVDGDDRVERGPLLVIGGDAVQVSLHQLGRRQGAGQHRGMDLGDRRLDHIEGSCRCGLRRYNRTEPYGE